MLCFLKSSYQPVGNKNIYTSASNLTYLESIQPPSTYTRSYIHYTVVYSFMQQVNEYNVVNKTHFKMKRN